MSVVSLPFNAASNVPQRTQGSGRLTVKQGHLNQTSIDRLYQQGAAKIRLPHMYDGPGLEAVLINSAGGLTGGDVFKWELSAASETRLTVTSQACEKIYKSTGEDAVVSTHIHVEEDARLDWLPQETILYDNARLDRELHVDLAENARFLAVEAVLLGRLAMGEQLNQFSMRDRWHIRREGRLVHAEALHFKESSHDVVQRCAVLDGHVAFATLFYASPDQDELSALATAFQEMLVGNEGGVSAFNGKLMVRLTAPDGLKLRKNLIPLIQKLRNNDPMPKVWMS